MVWFIQFALYANIYDHFDQDITVFLLEDEVVLGFDAGLKGVEVLTFILLDICGYSLQDVIRWGWTAACAALWAAGLWHHVCVVICNLVFLYNGRNSVTIRIHLKQSKPWTSVGLFASMQTCHYIKKHSSSPILNWHSGRQPSTNSRTGWVLYTNLDNGHALLAALFNESLFINLLSIKVVQPANTNKAQVLIRVSASEFWSSISAPGCLTANF